MSVVLYLLGAGLLAWSAYTVLAGDTFAALDIAASLAGWGVFAIGLGALTGAIGKLANTVAANGQTVSKAILRSPVVKQGGAPTSEPSPPARRLPASAALPPEGAETPVIEEPTPVESGAERRANRRGEEPDLERPLVVRPALGGGFAPRLDPNVVAADDTPAPAPAASKPAVVAKRPAIVPPPVTLRVDRPRVERAPAVAAPAREPAPQPPKPEPIVLASEPAPAPVEAETPAMPPASELTPPSPEPVDAAAPEEADVPPASEAEASPESDADAPQPESAAEPVPDAAPEPVVIALAEPDPVADEASEPRKSVDPADGPKVPDWLARARARRRARLDPEPETPRAAPVAEPRGRPGPAAPPPPAETPAREHAAAAVRTPELIREGEHGGVTYRFYDDDSVEAVSPHGVRRFASVDELRATVQAARGRDEAVAAPQAARSDQDPLDAALAELEGKPASEVRLEPQDRAGRIGLG